MGQTAGTAHRWRTREAVIVIAGVAAVIAVVLGVLAVTVVPPVLANLSAEAVETDTAVQIAEGGAATVTVPVGWVVRRADFGDDTLRLSSPDAEMTISLVESEVGLEEAFAAATDASGAVTERLASGLDARHVFADDHFTAAVGSGSGSGAVVVRAEAAPGAELGRYHAALALILDGVRVDDSDLPAPAPGSGAEG
ncbi:hypothetical protein [Microbacterium aquimaris]|uniref:Uncharacterized protein n=1 Tax=Microbacterium aquimaris TaxID=459816 RepID=A0ABU5N5T5_9MICO|nr:hypothetical protein [Microbacterium aquimaris]MDZ8161417.1 hypothetical protein [Microbacterium aquimaris]